MCNQPILVDFPCALTDDNQELLEDAGIEAETYEGRVLIDVNGVTTVTKGDNDNETVVELYAGECVVLMPIKVVCEVFRRCGVQVKRAEDVLKGHPRTARKITRKRGR